MHSANPYRPIKTAVLDVVEDPIGTRGQEMLPKGTAQIFRTVSIPFHLMPDHPAPVKFGHHAL